MLMTGTLVGNTVTLTSGTLSQWVQNLNADQMTMVQVAGYDSNNNQIIGSTKNPYPGDPTYTITGTNYYHSPNAFITSINSSTEFNVSGSWTGTSGIKIIISAPLYDLYGVVGRSSSPVSGPPYPSTQNPNWYNSDGQPPYFLLAATITDINASPPYTTFNIQTDLTSAQRGMWVGNYISGGSSLASGVSIPVGSKIIATNNFGPTSSNPTFTIDHQCLQSSGTQATVGTTIFNVYSHSTGAGFNGADQGRSVDLGPMGISGTSLTLWADTVWTKYPRQNRYGSNSPYLVHCTGLLQTGSHDITKASYKFIAGRQDAANPRGFVPPYWPATTHGTYGPFYTAGDSLIIGGSALFMYSTSAQRSLFSRVDNIIASSNPASVINSCVTTSGSRKVTVTGFGSAIFQHTRVSGTGIPYGACVDTIPTGNTFYMNLPATATATGSLSFYTNNLNTNTDTWVYTEIDHPWAEGLQRVNANQAGFYSNPNVKWTVSGVNVCGDGYIYTIGSAIRFPYQDLFTNNPFGNAERWLGSTAPTWNGSPAPSYVVDDGSGIIPPANTSGWVRQDVIQNDEHLLGLVQQNAQGVIITALAQRSDGTYLGIGIGQVVYYYIINNKQYSKAFTERGIRLYTSSSLTGPWNTSYETFAFNNITYYNSDLHGMFGTTSMWMYAPFFHPEVTWPGQGQDDIAISYTNFSDNPAATGQSAGWTNPQKYWTNMWIVSGL